MRRAKRITGEMMPVIKETVTGVQYLSLAQLTADLAERDVIVIGAESHLDRLGFRMIHSFTKVVAAKGLFGSHCDDLAVRTDSGRACGGMLGVPCRP